MTDEILPPGGEEGSWEDGIRAGSGEKGLGNLVSVQEVKAMEEEGSEWGRVNRGKWEVERSWGKDRDPLCSKDPPHSGKKEQRRMGLSGIRFTF